MSEFVIRQLLVLKDNYVCLLHEEASGATAVVDPSVAEPVLAALAVAVQAAHPAGGDAGLCGHEYTQANARFALTVEPDNRALIARAKAVDALRAESQPTVPATLGEEVATNPFLRADRIELQTAAGLVGHEPAAIFGEIRRRKDVF